ncbi:glycosyltransferase [Sediminicoccus sp. KRV36]|uniref:glycosyltransferase n=1 Tax=Sediminicoccus sp. KRV36 TaxID=3133721 RepID=UPI00200C6E28|nr:glycosyltransferase [Sediminicoccus rosea]UPY38152.1 glycosyltransferase [Sediminicoccus rosea]
MTQTGDSKRGFDQKAYWLQRHARYAGDARSVGNLALSHEQNLSGDRLVAEFLAHLVTRLRPRSILDLGCGYGRACGGLRPGSVAYLGIDLSPVALETARRDYPSFSFEEADLVTWQPAQRHDLVLCTYTLSSFPSDADWERVLGHALDALAEDGTLVIQDFLPDAREQKVQHVAYRGRADYARVLAARGFRWDSQLREQAMAERIGGMLARESHFIRALNAAPLGTGVSQPAAPKAPSPAPRTGLLRVPHLSVPAASPALREAPPRQLPPREVPPHEAPLRETLPARQGTLPHALRTERATPPRMLVVSWDMGHNPVGRGYLLADMARAHFQVEYTGPSFPRFGEALWAPVRGLDEIPTSLFPGADFPQFLQHALDVVSRHDPDVVYVSKPRLPSLLIGMLFRLLKGSALLVDVDDHELSFFEERTPLTLEEALAAARADPAGARTPFGEIWTRLSETLVAGADAVTVSNIALQARFGGEIVRHGRNEQRFQADPEIRAQLRQEFGLTAGDVVILFIGTPRPHKGIYRIADALERLDDDRLVFVIIGTITDARIRAAFAKYQKARIRFFGNQPWDRLPALIQMADQVAILQDPASPIAEYQVPAKLTDALSIGLPAIVTRVPPLADIIAQGAVTVVDDDAALDEVLRAAVPYEELPPAEIARVRATFLAEFSFPVNAARIAKAERIAAEASRDPPSPLLAEAVLGIARHYAVEHPLLDRLRGLAAPALVQRDRPLDLVFFWKQNDSDLYGRRSDMMVKYLLRSGRVGRILHFDRVISIGDLERDVDHSAHARLHQGNLVYLNTLRRVLRMADSPRLIRRSFLCRDGSRPQTALGQELPARHEYPDFIRATMREVGFDASAIAWVCPVVFDFPQIQAEIGFRRVIADVIDDQRKWPARPEHAERVARNYNDILTSADLVIANCAPLRESFGHLRQDIHVVPNGAEIFPADQSWELPEDLGALPSPRIGYVGNLRDRVDLGVIEAMAQLHPEWSIVLVGSAHDAPEVIALASRIPNIHLLGVRPYQEALAYIRHFDVAIMPHLSNDLSESMNPLKLYVYAALGVPIVCSEVANIGDISAHAAVARTRTGFIQAVEQALGKRGSGGGWDPAILARISWPERVKTILGLFDQLDGAATSGLANAPFVTGG